VATSARRVAKAAWRRSLLLRPDALVRSSRRGAFAVANVSRCGSSVLGQLLHQHPSIRFDGESYRHGLPSGMSLSDAARDGVHLELEATLQRRMAMSLAPWFGFDYQPLYLELGATDVISHAASLKELGFTHFVILRRSNLVRRLVSATRAADSGVYGVRSAGVSPRSGPVTLPTHGPSGEPVLVQRLDSVERFYSQVEAVHANDRVLHVDYERHIENDPRVAFRMVVEFLGLPQVEREVTLRRLNTRPTEEILLNYGEVSMALRGTKYEWMLD
jgi:hypothetical protein